ncbi:MAG: DUF4037 domain-containing protein [Peptococcaceae bacterium]
MKGLELSKLFYTEQVRPALAQRFPQLLPRIAAGLVGEGSQCFGYDDDLSQDHDWGAAVCLWLTLDDYENYGAAVQQMLMELPATFYGYPVSWVPGRNGVLEMGAFYRKYLNVDGVPTTIGQWLAIPAHHLAVATNGEVFEDELGKFSAIRNDLRQGYPEDIRRKKLAKCCMTIAQAGQYNYPRVMSRGDKVAAALTEGEFIQAVISAVYLLNNQYAPFYKWMQHGLKTLPRLGATVGGMLESLTAYPAAGMAEEDYYVQKIQQMQQICAVLVTELQRQGLSESNDPFLVEQGMQVHNHISHAGLRATNPWT